MPGRLQPENGHATDAACRTPPARQIHHQKYPLPRALRPGGRRLIGLKLDGV
ncbi:MAG: hypothetical protein U1B84_02030 [Variovorax sp.]|nr:hypothetical protein [Variovorax sp.]